MSIEKPTIQEKLQNPTIFQKVMETLNIPTQTDGESFNLKLKWTGKDFDKIEDEKVSSLANKLKPLISKDKDFKGEIEIKGRKNENIIAISDLKFKKEILNIPFKKETEEDEIKEYLKFGRKRLSEINRKKTEEEIRSKITEEVKKLYEEKFEEEKQKMAEEIAKIKKAIKKTIYE